jgi:hypothetical protein
VPGRSRPKVEGVDVHRSITLTPADITTVDGIPCTTVARTIHDLAAVVSRRATERAIEQAEIREVLDLRKLQDVLARNARTRGARHLRAIFADRFATAPTESELEEEFLALCRAAGLPLPERQVHIIPGDGEAAVRVDFCWRAQKLVVETDGGRYHRTPRDVRIRPPQGSAAHARGLAGAAHHLAPAQGRAAADRCDDRASP